ncbi:hypothetical protein GCM10027037_22090 [Mucilaginibacter koreensis]
MEEQKDTQQTPPQPILEQVREFAETQIKLAKYKAIEKGTSAAAGAMIGTVIAVFSLLLFLFLLFTLALYLGEVLGAYWKGFGCVSLLFLIIVLVCVFAKKSVEKPLVNLLIKKIFK